MAFSIEPLPSLFISCPWGQNWKDLYDHLLVFRYKHLTYNSENISLGIRCFVCCFVYGDC